jgi:flavodoxin
MKALVVYYSRTGNTKKVGDDLAKALPADVEEIIDTANRAGPLGFLKSAGEGSGRKLAKIQPAKTDAASYDIVVIGTPNWDANMSSPVRTYLTENKEKFKSIAFFLTEGVRGGSDRAFAEMEGVAGKKPKATLVVPMTALKSGSYVDKLKKFVEEVKS